MVGTRKQKAPDVATSSSAWFLSFGDISLRFALPLQAANQQVERLCEFPQLFSAQLSFEQGSIAARQLRIELAEKLNALGAQSHLNATAVVA